MASIDPVQPSLENKIKSAVASAKGLLAHMTTSSRMPFMVVGIDTIPSEAPRISCVKDPGRPDFKGYDDYARPTADFSKGSDASKVGFLPADRHSIVFVMICTPSTITALDSSRDVGIDGSMRYGSYSYGNSNWYARRILFAIDSACHKAYITKAKASFTERNGTSLFYEALPSARVMAFPEADDGEGLYSGIVSELMKDDRLSAGFVDRRFGEVQCGSDPAVRSMRVLCKMSAVPFDESEDRWSLRQSNLPFSATVYGYQKSYSMNDRMPDASKEDDPAYHLELMKAASVAEVGFIVSGELKMGNCSVNGGISVPALDVRFPEAPSKEGSGAFSVRCADIGEDSPTEGKIKRFPKPMRDALDAVVEGFRRGYDAKTEAARKCCAYVLRVTSDGYNDSIQAISKTSNGKYRTFSIDQTVKRSLGSATFSSSAYCADAVGELRKKIGDRSFVTIMPFNVCVRKSELRNLAVAIDSSNSPKSGESLVTLCLCSPKYSSERVIRDADGLADEDGEFSDAISARSQRWDGAKMISLGMYSTDSPFASSMLKEMLKSIEAACGKGKADEIRLGMMVL